MAKKEYIEREAAMKAICVCCNCYCDEGDCTCADKVEIMNIPVADVVEVVRCKDCTYGQSLDRTKPPFKYYKESCVMCTCEDVIGDEPMVYTPNHFCSYGVKKDGKEPLVKKDASPTDMSRCRKCVYEMTCFRDRDFEGTCPDYKRDAPDGGYYG